MTNIKILDEARTYVTDPANPDDKWDRDNTATEHDIRGFRVVGEQNYYDLSVDFEVDPTRPYFLVYAIYSTGDSFGHDDGCIEFVGLYESLDVAHENAQRLKIHNETYRQWNDPWYTPSKQMSMAELKKLEKNFEPYSVQLVTKDGTDYKMNVPWHGYFEHLDEVEVESVFVR